MIAPQEVIALVSIVITLFVNTIGGILWLSQKRKIAVAEEKVKITQERLKSSEEARKEVNKERDYMHLKNNQQQMLQMLPILLDEIRETQQNVSEIKTLLLSQNSKKENA